MKYLKMFSMLIVAASAVMAFAGTASAGTFTSPKGTTYTGQFHAVAGEMTTHGVATVTCQSSTIQGTITSHGSSVTGLAHINTLTFSSCGTHKTVETAGTLEFHTHPGDSNGGAYAIVTSSGMTVNINLTQLGITCGLRTESTEIGTMTNSTHRQVTGEAQTTATIHIDALIPRHSGSFFCGSSIEWTGTYEITTPDYLDYD